MSLPLALLHALPLDSSMWEATARELRARGRRVLTPDLCGFGSAPLPPGPPSLDAVADALARELDRQGIGEVALAGCSMGGYVAMAFLRRHPDRVRALALLAARSTADGAEAAARRLRFAEAVLDDSARPALVAATTPSLLGATTGARRPRLPARVTGLALAAPPGSVAWAQRAIAARTDSTAALRAADVPAVVVIGAEDALVSLDEACRTAEALGRGRLLVLPGVGHLAPLEAPEAVAGILSDLLAQARTTAEGATAGTGARAAAC
ncbi:pimeloyl-ACP methyl ester carboxylesterase [Streptomyces sp. 2132.2]|uniref:alpha/beta fold hydrolase n=1 Tax=Streptomyces sp. 2132.2 TaxID=2485161 RepID=UPI000F492E24|nr:alpha/beta hydrolase [Streptomyces sp. 2132.2]ROQ95817.1 pimeloyl-ACP methyl ester carboxylesterase [Streptomyces sp. 2132.2]